VNIIYGIETEGMFKYREFIAQIKYKEVISSPVYFIPVLLLSIMIIIEGFHIFNHKQNCKTKAEWMEQSGMTYDRESEVN
jgi:hypothetical protein